MNRRKGERPLPQTLDSYSPLHPVAHAIATGDTWFTAWQQQKGLPLVALTKLTGMTQNRLLTIDWGDRISRAELDALAIAWRVSAGDLIASMADPSIVVD